MKFSKIIIEKDIFFNFEDKIPLIWYRRKLSTKINESTQHTVIGIVAKKAGCSPFYFQFCDSSLPRCQKKRRKQFFPRNTTLRSSSTPLFPRWT